VLERGGDFSDLATTQFSSFTDSNGNPTVVRGDSSPSNFAATLTQRLGYTVSPGEQYWFQGCTTTSQCVFPGAAGPFIPQAAWSPVAVKTLKFIPTPTGASGGTPFHWRILVAQMISRPCGKWVPPDAPVGVGINFSVFTATGDQAACGINGPAAPGNTHWLVVVQPWNQYCSPGETVYPNVALT